MCSEPGPCRGQHQHATLTRPCRNLRQQRRLTDAGLAAHHDRASLRSDAIDQIFDERNLPLTPAQASRGVPLDHPAASLCLAAIAAMRHPLRPGCRDVFWNYLVKRWTKARAMSATSRQPLSMTREWPRLGSSTISVTPWLRFCFL